MSFLSRSLFSKVFSKFFGNYIKDSDEGDAEASILKGEFLKKDINFKEDILLNAHTPFKIVKGSAKLLELKLYPQNKFEGSKLTLDGLDLTIKLINDVKEYQIKALLFQIAKSLSKEQNSLLSHFTQKILQKIDVSITNVTINITVEDSPYPLKVLLPSISIQNQEIAFKDISIFITRDNETDEFLLEKFSFQGKISYNSEKQAKILDISIDKVNMQLTDNQWKLLLDFKAQISNLYNKILYSCHDLANDKFSSLYHYTYSYISSDYNKLSFNPKTTLSILKSRKQIIDTLKSGNETMCKNLIDRFKFLPLMNLIDNMPKHAKNESQSEEEDSNSPIFITTKSFQMNFCIKELDFKLILNSEPLINIFATGFSSKLETNDVSLKFNFEIERHNITGFGSGGNSFYNCSGKVVGNTLTDISSFKHITSIEFPSCNFNLDLSFISQLHAFFSRHHSHIISDNTTVGLEIGRILYRSENDNFTFSQEGILLSINGESIGNPISLCLSRKKNNLAAEGELNWEFNLSKESFSAFRKLEHLLQNTVSVTNLDIRINSMRLNFLDEKKKSRFYLVFKGIDVTKQFACKISSVSLCESITDLEFLQSDDLVMIPSRNLYYLVQFRSQIKVALNDELLKFFLMFIRDDSELIREIKLRIETKDVLAAIIDGDNHMNINLQPSSFEISQSGEFSMNAGKPMIECLESKQVLMSSSATFYLQYFNGQVDSLCRDLYFNYEEESVNFIQGFVKKVLQIERFEGKLVKFKVNFEKLKVKQNEITLSFNKFMANNDEARHSVFATFQSASLNLSEKTVLEITQHAKLFLHFGLPSGGSKGDLTKCDFTSIESTLECKVAKINLTKKNDNSIMKILKKFSIIESDNRISHKLNLDIDQGYLKIEDLCQIEFRELYLDNIHGFSASLQSLKLTKTKGNEVMININEKQSEDQSFDMEVSKDSSSLAAQSLYVNFDYNFFYEFVSFIKKSPLYAMAKINEKNSFFVNVKDMSLKLPIRSNSQDYLSVDFDFTFEFADNNMKISLSEFCLGFFRNSKTISKITNNFGINFDLYGSEVGVNITNPEICLNTVDIAAICVICKTFRNYSHVFRLIFDRFTGISDLYVSNWSVNVGKVKLCLFFSTQQNDNDFIPFLRLIVDTFDFKLNFQTLEQCITHIMVSKCEVFNISTNLWDTAVDPFPMDMTFSPKNNTLKFDVNCPITTALNFNSTTELVTFMDDSIRRVQSGDTSMQKAIPFTIFNNTAEALNVSVPGKSNFNIKSLESVEISAKVNSSIRFSQNQRVQSLSISDLLYPLYFRKNIVVYRDLSLDKTSITFSSIVLFKNETDFEILMCKKCPEHKRELLSKMEKGKLVPLPSTVLTTERITFVDKQNMEHGKRLPRFEFTKLIKMGTTHEKLPIGKNHLPVIFEETTIHSNVRLFQIKYNFVVENELPENISIAISNVIEKVSIPSNSKKGFSYDPSLTFSMKVFLDGSDVKPCKLHICSKDMTIPCQIGKYTFAATVMSDQKGKVHISIYSPLIIYNKSECNFSITDNQHKEIYEFDENKRICFSDQDFFKSQSKRSIKFFPFVANPKVTHKFPIECVGMTDNQFYLLPIDEDKVTYSPIKYTILSQGHSRIITFYSALYVLNNLDFNLVISPNDSDNEMVIRSGRKKVISISSVTWTFLVRKENSPISTTLILQNPTTTNFLLLHDGDFSQVYFEVTKENNNMLVTFSKAVLTSSPIILTNETKYNVYAFQEGHDHLQKFKPSTTSVFAYNSPFGVSNITVSVKEKEITIPMSSVNEVFHFDEFFVEQVLSGNGSRLIYVSSERMEKKEKKHFVLGVKLSNISYSLIDDKFREISLLTINGVSFGIDRMEATTNIKLSVDKVELDDMHPMSLFEVALLGLHSANSSSFLAVDLVMKNNTKLFSSFQSINVQTGTLEVYADMAYFNDLIQVLRKIFVKNYIPFNTSSKSLVTCETFNISQTQVDISIEPETARPMEQPPFSFTLIPIASSARFVVDGIFLENLVSSPEFIFQNIFKLLLNSFKLKVSKIFFSVDIIFNIGGISANIAKQRESNENTGKIVSSTALRIGETITTAAGKLAHSSHGMSTIQGTSSQNRIGVNQTAGETVASGFKSLGSSIVDGPVGLIMDPIRGAKKDGFTGFVKGIGTGLTGLVMHPVSGVIDATGSLITASRKALDGNSDVHKRSRQERCLPFNRVMPYNEKISKFQAVIRKNDNTSNERVEVILSNEPLIVSSSRRIYEASFDGKKYKIQSYKSISHFVNIASIDNELRIDTDDNKTIKYECDSEVVANQCLAFLRSVIDPTIANWL